MTSSRNLKVLLFTAFLVCSGWTVAADSTQCQRHSQSCNACIEAGPDCSWCTMPDFTGSRCDTVQKLNANGCKRPHIYEAKPEITFATTNLPLGSNKDDGSVVQLQPQSLQITAAPGQKSIFPLTYLHVVPQPTDIYVLNSAVDSLDYKLSYSVECKGQVQDINVCRSVQQGEIVSFNVTVEVNNCTKENRNGAYVSVGVGGVRDIVALLVLPICGCQCEREEEHEKYSSHCGHRGDLVCGMCRCEPNFTGSKCQCHTPAGSRVLEQCKQYPGAQECSGKGSCECGKCQCNEGTISGSYCECDNSVCPKIKGRICADHGSCVCGLCKCNPGYSGDDCACPASNEKCLARNGQVCNNAGRCQCGTCECRIGYTGPTCEQFPEVEAEKQQMSPSPKSGDEDTEDGDDDNDDDDDDDNDDNESERSRDQTKMPKADATPSSDKSEKPSSDQHSGAEPEPKREPEPAAAEAANDAAATAVLFWGSFVFSPVTTTFFLLIIEFLA